MKRIPLLALIVFAPAALSAPFLVADVASGVAQCRVFLNGKDMGMVQSAGNQCRYDLAGLAPGTFSATMTALTTADPLWGTQESVQSAALPFTKPSAPAVPSGLTLTP